MKPALHAQAVTFLEAAGDMELLRHVTQALLPITALYCPGRHGAHAPPLGPVNPRKHWQAVDALDPAGAEAFAGQGVQAALPADTLKVFAVQCWQELTLRALTTL